ncbi:multicopper oxidase domain-containing protein [Micromonospora sp. NPDC051296]|uniref:multicopper oxidase domain-containing protein n=1 Tax=Micromonospora sp. NPDC051296 TaxID=3155046 RepID=UPI00343B6CFD
MPIDGTAVRVQVGGAPSVVLGSNSFDAPTTPRPTATLDLLRYGTRAPLGFDPGKPDRSFRYDIGRRLGFLDGRPGYYWTINGHLYPDVPMFMVGEGDVVRMTISNGSGEVHPMHLHGHHAVVLSRNGAAATGSPTWVDSLNVNDGESYEIAFVANNPGIWVDHCHNLTHAVEGLIAHLMYEGFETPYVIGDATGNQPE